MVWYHMVPKWPFLFPKGHHWEIGCWQGSISRHCARNTYQRASRKVIFRIRSLQRYIAWIPTHVGVNTSTTLLGWTWRQIVSILEAMIFIYFHKTITSGWFTSSNESHGSSQQRINGNLSKVWTCVGIWRDLVVATNIETATWIARYTISPAG